MENNAQRKMRKSAGQTYFIPKHHSFMQMLVTNVLKLKHTYIHKDITGFLSSVGGVSKIALNVLVLLFSTGILP